MKVIVGSLNPVKVEAVKQAFEAYFPTAEVVAIGQKAPSGVRDQPSGKFETYTGALNRAKYCKETYKGDYFVGLEGGIAPFFDTSEIALIEWAVALGKNSTIIGKAGGEMLPLPQELCDLLKVHKELGHAMDAFCNQHNSKQNEGTTGFLTQGIIKRTSSFRDKTVKALVPHVRAWEK